MDNEIYDKQFMLSALGAETKSAKIMSETIYSILKPKTFIDVGCGPGHFANEFKKLGKDKISVTATDFSNYSKEFIDPSVKFMLKDLRVPFNLNKKYDVVLCLEVIEHIDKKYEDTLCKNLIDLTKKYLIITAAPPGQFGLNHVNCKPLDYWKTKFIELGLVYDEGLTYKMISIWKNIHRGLVVNYFINNFLVFSK